MQLTCSSPAGSHVDQRVHPRAEPDFCDFPRDNLAGVWPCPHHSLVCVCLNGLCVGEEGLGAVHMLDICYGPYNLLFSGMRRVMKISEQAANARQRRRFQTSGKHGHSAFVLWTGPLLSLSTAVLSEIDDRAPGKPGCARALLTSAQTATLLLALAAHFCPCHCAGLTNATGSGLWCLSGSMICLPAVLISNDRK